MTMDYAAAEKLFFLSVATGITLSVFMMRSAFCGRSDSVIFFRSLFRTFCFA